MNESYQPNQLELCREMLKSTLERAEKAEARAATAEAEYTRANERMLAIAGRVEELEADNARLREIVTLTETYLDAKKSWDNRKPELIRLKDALKKLEEL